MGYSIAAPLVLIFAEGPVLSELNSVWGKGKEPWRAFGNVFMRRSAAGPDDKTDNSLDSDLAQARRIGAVDIPAIMIMGGGKVLRRDALTSIPFASLAIRTNSALQ
jgi:hypothetical protein